MSAAAATRPCLGLVIPPGPGGLELLVPALGAAIDGSGPALALEPGTGSAQYRSRIRAAVRPGDQVPDDVALVVATSGSTGDPAGVLLPWTALTSATRALGHVVGSPGGHSWVAALPLHHAGGAMVAVRSVVSGSPVTAAPSLGGAQPFTPEGFARATRQAAAAGAGMPLAVSLVPAMLAALESAGTTGLAALAAYDLVLVGGAAAPAGLLDRMRAAGIRVRASYGMTETSGGAVVDGRPLPGTSVSVAAGLLQLSGDQVALGYRDGRAPGRWSTVAGQRAFRTSDLGEISADGTVRVLGRSDDVVQVGGASVSLAAVREALGDDPRVVAAEVVARPDPRWGARVVGFVQPAASGGARSEGGPAVERGPGTLAAGLADAVGLRLGAAARPRPVVVLAELPQLESGKVDRQALSAIADRIGRIAP